MHFNHILIVILLTMLWPGAQARDFSVGPITVSNAWSPPLPPVAENGVVYFSLSNHELKADRMMGASTPLADRVEFHTSVKSGSMMRMQQMHTVELSAHGNVALQPGGVHVMLIGLKNPLNKGTSFPLTLTFEQAGSVTIDVQVRAPAEAAIDPTRAPTTAPAIKHGKHKH